MRLDITLKNETKSVFGERPEHGTSIIVWFALGPCIPSWKHYVNTADLL